MYISFHRLTSCVSSRHIKWYKTSVHEMHIIDIHNHTECHKNNICIFITVLVFFPQYSFCYPTIFIAFLTKFAPNEEGRKEGTLINLYIT